MIMDLEERFKFLEEECQRTIQNTEKDLQKIDEVSAVGRILGILDENAYIQRKKASVEELEKYRKRLSNLQKFYDNFNRLKSLSDSRLRIVNSETTNLDDDPVYRHAEENAQEKFRDRTLTETEYAEGWAKVFPMKEENEDEDPLYIVQQQSGIGQKRLQEIMDEFDLSTAQIIDLNDLAREYHSSLSHLVEIYLKQDIPLKEIGKILEVRESFMNNAHQAESISRNTPAQLITSYPSHKVLLKIYDSVERDIDSFERLMNILNENKGLSREEDFTRCFEMFANYCMNCAVKGIHNVDIIGEGWVEQVERFVDHDEWDTVSHRRELEIIESDQGRTTSSVYNGGIQKSDRNDLSDGNHLSRIEIASRVVNRVRSSE